MFTSPLDMAEQNVSTGKPYDGDFVAQESYTSSEMIARRKLVMVMKSLTGKEYAYGDLRAVLSSIASDPYTPQYLRVESGYLIILLDKLENHKQQLSQVNGKYQACVEENKMVLKELEELNYKLKKLEEIYIDTEKKRVQQ